MNINQPMSQHPMGADDMYAQPSLSAWETEAVGRTLIETSGLRLGQNPGQQPGLPASRMAPSFSSWWECGNIWLSGTNPINLGFPLERFSACCCRQHCPECWSHRGHVGTTGRGGLWGEERVQEYLSNLVSVAIMDLSDCGILLEIQMLGKERRESRWSNTCLKKTAPKKKELDGFVFVCSEVMATEHSFSKINCFSILQKKIIKSNEKDAREHPFISTKWVHLCQSKGVILGSLLQRTHTLLEQNVIVVPKP